MLRCYLEQEYEPLLVAYLSLLVREMFIRNFFVRTFVLDDLLKKTRALIINYRADPNNVGVVRLNLNTGSRDIVMLQETLSYLNESLGSVTLPTRPDDANGAQLFEYLNVATLLHDVVRVSVASLCDCAALTAVTRPQDLRTKDLMKLVEGAHHELANLQQMTDVINTKQLEDVFRNVDSNTKYLVDASAASERSSASLEVMQVILAGSFAFDIVDRLSGGSLNITVPDWVNSMVVDPVITVPGLWLLINLVRGNEAVVQTAAASYPPLHSLRCLAGVVGVCIHHAHQVDALPRRPSQRSVDAAREGQHQDRRGCVGGVHQHKVSGSERRSDGHRVADQEDGVA